MSKWTKKKVKSPKDRLYPPDPEDSWARVELYRWQYGELPFNSMKTMDISEGLKGMAAAIDKGDPKNFPTPFNVSSVLRFAAKQLSK